jgi:hypothetical protein
VLVIMDTMSAEICTSDLILGATFIRQYSSAQEDCNPHIK